MKQERETIQVESSTARALHEQAEAQGITLEALLSLLVKKEELSAEIVAMNSPNQLDAQSTTFTEFKPRLEEILDATIALLNADYGNIQLYDSATGALKIVVQRGFRQDFLDYFDNVHEGTGSCGTALHKRERVIVEDVLTDPIFAPHMEIVNSANYRAVQSTPLFGRNGEPLGMLSTHFRRPHRPSDRELEMADLFVRQAEEMIERKNAEEERRLQRRSDVKFRLLLEKLPAAAYTCDAEGLITYYNQRAIDVWGREPKLNDLEDRFCGSFKLYATDGKPILNDQCWMALALKENTEYNGCEIIIERPDGSRIPVLAHANPIHDESGKVLGAVNVLVDISDRKQAEIEKEELLLKEKAARAEAQAANRSKDEFISLISHELRSPLNSVLIYSRLMRSNPHDAEKIDQFCELIDRNAQTQLRLIEDLLDTARIVSGKLRIDKRSIDIVPLLASALNEVRQAAEDREIELRSHYSQTSEMIIGDPVRLQQVIENLLSNAIKFTPKGGRIETRLEHREESLYIIVSDTGVGIDPSFLPHIFDRFSQADSSNSHRHGGLGLGLALVKHLVELHGGTIEAASEGSGMGSTFTVMLPLTMQNGSFEKEPPALILEGALPAPDTSKVEDVGVLVVDDQQEAREALANYLGNCGAVVTAVSSGIEALKILADPPDGERPDVLICDIAMPEEDGYAVMRRVRALEAERRVKISQRIPAIALTGMASREDWVQALSAGFNTHLVKPVDPAELVKLISSLAKGRSKKV
jgi:PAS domain S-box-containing protein